MEQYRKTINEDQNSLKENTFMFFIYSLYPFLYLGCLIRYHTFGMLFEWPLLISLNQNSL